MAIILVGFDTSRAGKRVVGTHKVPGGTLKALFWWKQYLFLPPVFPILALKEEAASDGGLQCIPPRRLFFAGDRWRKSGDLRADDIVQQIRLGCVTHKVWITRAIEVGEWDRLVVLGVFYQHLKRYMR